MWSCDELRWSIGFFMWKIWKVWHYAISYKCYKCVTIWLYEYVFNGLIEDVKYLTYICGSSSSSFGTHDVKFDIDHERLGESFSEV